MKKIVVVNGPNLNFLGIREKSVYGKLNYNEVVSYILDYAKKEDLLVEVFQSNSEGGIIDRLQQCYHDGVDGVIINPGAYTHYSYAIRDAIASIMIPTIEMHISNIYVREDFRKISVIKDVCVKQIYGKGIKGYIEALEYFKQVLTQ
ncbi:MAG: type II 3-dehydroquinate dehydratase [Firmicutes bacterium HGW-Firmicutes-1]|nr:MAG: type II 3-dehydroquinate dehydratase [Firmicutes bacterium HGW-Firmicutes-1]